MSATAISLPRLARHNPLAAIGGIFVGFFIVCAIFAPWIAPQDPAHINLATRLAPPSLLQICGSDELGRDILSRLIYGSRISMLVGSCVVGLSLGIGLIIGSIAGYYGGRLDRFVNVVVMNAFLSFPGILIAIAFVAFRGPGIFNLVFALSLGGWVGYARLVRAQVLAAREKEYVEAARALGASDLRILARHIRNGGGDSCRSHDEFPRAGRSTTYGVMGRNAQRRPRTPFRRTAFGYLPRAGGDAGSALVQLHRGCTPRPA